MRKCSSHSLKTASFLSFALISSSFCTMDGFVNKKRLPALSPVLHKEQKNCPFVERKRGVGIRLVSHNSIGETSLLHSLTLKKGETKAHACAMVWLRQLS